MYSVFPICKHRMITRQPEEIISFVVPAVGSTVATAGPRVAAGESIQLAHLGPHIDRSLVAVAGRSQLDCSQPGTAAGTAAAVAE